MINICTTPVYDLIKLATAHENMLASHRRANRKWYSKIRALGVRRLSDVCSVVPDAEGVTVRFSRSGERGVDMNKFAIALHAVVDHMLADRGIRTYVVGEDDSLEELKAVPLETLHEYAYDLESIICGYIHDVER